MDLLDLHLLHKSPVTTGEMNIVRAGSFSALETCKRFTGEPALNHDRVLWPLLRQVQQGFFVESGALDGLRVSNTFVYERKLGWRGLLVEPNPKNFEKLLANQKAGLRSAPAFNGCLSFSNSTERDVMFAGDEAVGKRTSLKEYRVENKIKKNMFQATCVPLKQILSQVQQQARPSVAYWVLDVEGAEFSILQATPFDEIEFGVLQVENGFHKVHALLQAKGFQMLAGTVQDAIFVNTSFFARRGIELRPLQIERRGGIHYGNPDCQFTGRMPHGRHNYSEREVAARCAAARAFHSVS